MNLYENWPRFINNMFCMQYDSDNNNSNVYRAIDHCYTDTMVGIIPYCVADDTVYIILFLYKFGQYWLLSVARVYILYYIYFIFCIYLFSRHNNIIITVAISRSEYTCVLYIIISYMI